MLTTPRLIPHSEPRCHGNGSPLCLGCGRRLQAEADHDADPNTAWVNWVAPLSVRVKIIGLPVEGITGNVTSEQWTCPNRYLPDPPPAPYGVPPTEPQPPSQFVVIDRHGREHRYSYADGYHWDWIEGGASVQISLKNSEGWCDPVFWFPMVSGVGDAA